MARRIAALVLLVGVAAGCGKRGNPLPPLRPVPGRVVDLRAVRAGDRVALSFTVPAANVDGTTPPAIDRVEVYGRAFPAGAPAVLAEQVTADPRNLRGTVRVRPPVVEGTPQQEASERLPAPGEAASFSESMTAGPGDAAITYVVVGVTAGARGRRGAPSGLVTIPLTGPPAPPEGLMASHDEMQIRLAWTPAASPSVQVLASDAPFSAASARLLTPAPLTTPEFSVPVEFGRAQCFAVRSVQVVGQATIEGPLSAPQCLTPVDRFPPPAPAGLQAVQEGTAVTLNWTAVNATDLAGYVVLRGDGAGENMQPLMRTPIMDTTFKDTAVQVGSTYTYSVYAVDTAPGANVSQQSNRQVVTVR